MSDAEDTTTGHALHSGGRRGPARVGASMQEMLGLAVLALILLPGLREMAAVWSRLDYYSHGYMIPFVALWAASAQRHVLPRLPRSHDARGAALIAASLVAYLLGLAAGLVWLAGVATVAVLAGAVLYARGPAWLRALAFPIGYLLFMVPVPDAWLAPLIVRLQLLVSSAGTALLHVLGQPVLRVGNVLQLPSGEELFVAEACSGITSLITLVPLGVFLAYFVERGFWRRSLLVLTVVPVALAGNLVRVLLTVAVAGELGAEAATESSLHVWVGLSTYVLACLVLLGVGGWMRRSWPPAPAP